MGKKELPGAALHALPGERVSPEQFVQDAIEQFRSFHNLENGDHGRKLGYNRLTDDLYPRDFLPCLATIYNVAVRESNQPAIEDSFLAFDALRNSLHVITEYEECTGFSGRTAFMAMRTTAIRGDCYFPKFTLLMANARHQTAEVIRKYGHLVPPDTPIQIKNGPEEFGVKAQRALREYEHAENGVNLGPEFTDRLHNPNTKAFVVSIDINSTVTTGESFATVPLIDRATAQLAVLADEFETRYPDKSFYLVLNTGRPALYAWGAMEMLPPIPHLRVFGLAESGGVIFGMEGTQLIVHVAVKNPHQWQKQLIELRSYLLAQIKNTQEVIVEPKESMLSLRIATREHDGGAYLHETIHGATVTGDWIAQQTDAYFDNTQAALKERLDALRITIKQSDQTDEALIEFVDKIGQLDRDGTFHTLRHADQGTLLSLENVFASLEGYRLGEMDDITTALEALSTMQCNLAVQFNKTAGFVDIANPNLNKYSTLRRALEAHNIFPHESLILHIGDSSTDIMPTYETGKGENNEGADDVYLIAVKNCSSGLQDAVQQRGPYGVFTARESILGLSDTITGIQWALMHPLIDT